jgi:hypothetical protein
MAKAHAFSLDEETLDLTLRVRKGEGQSTQPTAKEAPEEETHLDGVDLALELAGLVGGDRGGDDRARDTAGTAEGRLARDKDVRDVLVLAEEREVEQDLDRLGVCESNEQFTCEQGHSHAVSHVEVAYRHSPAVMTMNSQIPRLRVCGARVQTLVS